MEGCARNYQSDPCKREVRDHSAKSPNLHEAQATGFEHWSRRNRLTLKFALVLVSLIFGLAISEVALRIIGYSYPIFYTTDVDRGIALKPNIEGWYRKEGASFVQINSDGLRDREHTKVKSPDTLRIAVIGDSYAEALQVAQEDAFWSIMEKRLQGCAAFGGRRVEVINFGVSGYGTAQELLTLQKHVWQYEPDIVLLAVTTNNDITDNSRALKQTDEIPYFVHHDGRLVLDNSFRETRAFRLRQTAFNRLGRWFQDHLRVLQAIHQGQVAFKNYLATRKAQRETQSSATTTNIQTNADARAQTAASGDIGIDNMIYREPHDAVWTDAWQVTEELLTRMRDEVKQHGAKFLVVTLSNGIQVHPDASARAAFMQRVGSNDLFYPDRRIKSLGERENFPVLMLAPALQAYAEQHKVFLHGFGREIGNGHWNELGHRLGGELIAEQLCAGAGQ